MDKQNLKIVLSGISFAFICFALASILITNQSQTKIKTQQSAIDSLTCEIDGLIDLYLSEVNKELPLNRENLLKELKMQGIKFPKIVLAQAILETGNFQSRLCKESNNIFGLYNSNKMEFFHFMDWQECVRGYKTMIEYRHRDDEDYYSFLKRIGYAEDPDYISKLINIVSTL